MHCFKNRRLNYSRPGAGLSWQQLAEHLWVLLLAQPGAARAGGFGWGRSPSCAEEPSEVPGCGQELGHRALVPLGAGLRTPEPSDAAGARAGLITSCDLRPQLCAQCHLPAPSGCQQFAVWSSSAQPSRPVGLPTRGRRCPTSRSGVLPLHGDTRPLVARGTQVHGRLLMLLTVIAADIKGKGGETACFGWMSLKIHSQHRQLLASLTYIPWALGRRDP